MSEVSGVLQNIITRTTGNGKPVYDIVVGGQKYGYGFFPPKEKEGDYVTFKVTQNGNFKNVERGSLKASAYKEAPESGRQQAVRQAVSSFDSRQDTISRQAASNTAIQWVAFLQTAGALPTTAKSKGSLATALDAIRSEYEKQFYEANTGVEWKDIRPNIPEEELAPEEFAPTDEEWQ